MSFATRAYAGGNTLLLFDGETYKWDGLTNENVTLTLRPNGTWDVTNSQSSPLWTINGPLSGNWYNPTTAGIGNSYWVRFTVVQDNSIAPSDVIASTTWVSLGTNAIARARTNSGTFGSGTFQVDLSTSSSGTPIIATAYITLIIN